MHSRYDKIICDSETIYKQCGDYVQNAIQPIEAYQHLIRVPPNLFAF